MLMKRIESLFSSISALALFVMMWLTVVDVVGRKFFDNSLTGAVELTEIVMTITIFFALPVTSRAGEHIVFDLLDRVLPAGLRRWQGALSQAMTGVALLAAAWVVGGRAARTVEYGDVTAQLAIPLGYLQWLVAAMLVVTAGVHLFFSGREAAGRSDGAAS